MAGETIIVRQGLRGIKGDKGDPGPAGRDGTGVVPSAGQVVAGGASGSTVDLASGQYPKGDGTNVVAGDFAADVAATAAVARVDPGTAGARGQVVTAKADGTPIWRSLPTLDLRDYCVLDGVTDGVTGWEAAMADAKAAGGARILVPGPLTLTTVRTTNVTNIAHHAAITSDNILVDGQGYGSITGVSAGTPCLFFISGAGKANGIVNWTTGMLPSNGTLYAVTPIAQGDKTITFTTPTDAANFAVGDLIFIQTGQVLEMSQPIPDSESNELISVNTSTGVCGLRYPAAKAYAQENVDTAGGSTYTSKVGGAGAAVPFGVKKATANYLKHVGFRDIALIAPGNSTIVGDQVIDWALDNVALETATAGVSMSNIRHVRHRDCRVKLTGGTYTYFLGYGYGSVDIDIAGSDLAAVNENGYLHFHEGCSQVRAHDNYVTNPVTTAASHPVVSVRARAYDIRIQHNDFLNSSSSLSTPCVYVDGTCPGGGVIGPNTYRGTHAVPVAVGSTGWKVRESAYASLTTPGTEVQEVAYSAILSPANPTVTLGTLPQYAYITQVICAVTTAFNSDGTDQVSVGIDGSPTLYGNNVDVSTTGVKAMTFVAANGWLTTAARTMKAYYTAGGSAPTTGRALVIIKWVQAQNLTAVTA